MRSPWPAYLVSVALVVTSCNRSPGRRTYTLQGQVLSLTPDRHEATIKHEEIRGLMPAMTMPYKVKESKLLDSIAPGDLIDARLVIVSNDAYLTELRKVGQAPLERPTAGPSEAAPASTGLEVLKTGQPVPDAAFVDQDGRKRNFRSFRGSTLVVTFIYTRCPLPMFCPLMDRHFAAVQERLHEDPALQHVHLISVSFDPLADTPPVLKKHARELEADPKRWTFLTGDRDDIDQFAARFGVFVSRAPNDPRDITHNLRTAIVSRDGTLVKLYTGNEWTPDEILTDLKPVVSAN